jgi:antitoxin PrlF
MDDQRVPNTKLAERMFTQRNGATMDEVIAATGGPQYNVLRKLDGRGYRIRKVKEGRATRYFATPPAAQFYEAAVTSKGQITLPRQVRERLSLRAGGKVRFTAEDGDRIIVTRGGAGLSDLFGMLGRPPRSSTLEEMDKAVRQGAVARYLRAVGKKR